MSGTDAIVVGAGPNGLAAAVTLARAGLEVELYEARDTPGGGTRTEQLIEPGHWHDACSAVHPMAFASPFFAEFGLAERIDWFVPEISYGHPLDGGRAALAYHDLERTVANLGRDGRAYRRLLGPLIRHSEEVLDVSMHPLLRRPDALVRLFPALLALGLGTAWQGTPAWNLGFRGEAAPALLSGAAAHTVTPQPRPATAAAGLVLSHLAHTVGWPIPRGGSQQITQALLADFTAHGGRLHLGSPVTALADLPQARARLLDIAPTALAELTPGQLRTGYLKSLNRFEYGNAACKVDFILSGPIPWQYTELSGAGTVHVAGARAEVAAAEAQVARGQHPERPYVLVSQPSRFDSGRAPAGREIVWSYCHVPAGSDRDMSAAMIAQIERFAPGFRDLIVGFRVTPAAELSKYNANYPGGDFGTGRVDLRQLLARPVLSPTPWQTPLPGTYLCSAGTAPGPGVHGMAGLQAAELALKEVFGLPRPSLAPGE
ncbi:phytoene desaturase family protein [Acaricomes phytoseiuli]|uniref:phytoene desaturase family protein n=1 Tax=Acaricomes phytoseiuli TaxID=291968 RepID=UPI0003655FD2|nr:NAD(P)/FAD-dependent oxidoreductase [Acaricomes phytoseiuli]